ALVVFLQVVRITNLVPDFELKIPQRVQDGFDRFFVDRILEEEKQVDVGLGVDRCAAVTTDRHQGEGVWIVAVAPELPDNPVQLLTNNGFNLKASGIGKESGFQVVYK